MRQKQIEYRLRRRVSRFLNLADSEGSCRDRSVSGYESPRVVSLVIAYFLPEITAGQTVVGNGNSIFA